MIKTLIDILRESRDASKERLKLSIVPIYLTILAFSIAATEASTETPNEQYP